MPTKISAILPYKTGLPKDVSVNSFYSTATFGSTEGNTFAGLVYDLYAGDSVDGWDGFGEYLGDQIDKLNCQLRAVEFNPATGKEVGEAVYANVPLVAGTGSNNFPDEVAICLSYEGNLVGGNQKRNRGRIFLGPLTASINTYADSDSPQVSPNKGIAIVTAASRIMSAGASANAPFCLYSSTDAVLRSIQKVWMDDAFDTQRRRGVQPTLRWTQSVAITP